MDKALEVIEPKALSLKCHDGLRHNVILALNNSKKPGVLHTQLQNSVQNCKSGIRF
jgi:hypothetical protein